MKKQLIITTLVIVLIISGCTNNTSNSDADNTQKQSTQKNETIPEETTIKETETETEVQPITITLSFVGDLLCATDEYTSYENSFEEVVKRVEPSYFLEKVSSYFFNDDYTIGDCENVYSDDTDLTVRDKGQYDNPNDQYFFFKTDSKNAEILKAGGIDLVSTSNNHIEDYGAKGHQDTLDALDSVGVKWGEENHTVYFEKEGFKIAFICVSMYNDGFVPAIKEHIDDADKKSDYQVIYFHGGTEKLHEPENWKINACHDLIDYGADLIIGDHPHVLQPREIYKDKTIIYSMGNFVFGGNRHPENRTIIYQHTLTVSPDKSLKESGEIIPCYVYTGEMNNWQPAIVEDEDVKQNILDFMDGKAELKF